MNWLRSLGMDLHNYHDCYHHFPAGTIPNSALPPEERISWLAELSPFTYQCAPMCPERSRSWDDPENYPPRCPPGTNNPNVPLTPCGHVALFICPANQNRGENEVVGYTHYVGVAGIGAEIAYGPKEYPFAGAFGYDRFVSLEDIQDGASRTMLVIETATDNGPWTRGGPSTVRALDPGGLPYLGLNGQFSSLHRPQASDAIFADASVHALSASIEPRVFEALATIAGHEEVGDDY